MSILHLLYHMQKKNTTGVSLSVRSPHESIRSLLLVYKSPKRLGVHSGIATGRQIPGLCPPPAQKEILQPVPTAESLFLIRIRFPVLLVERCLSPPPEPDGKFP